MNYAEMPDGYWNDRKIEELAWFLSTGQMDGSPRLSSSSCIEELHSAYFAKFIPILEHLMRATFSEKRAGKLQPRTTEFSRVSICKIFENHHLGRHIHCSARNWLDGTKVDRRERPFKERPSDKWVQDAWKKFIAAYQLEFGVVSEHGRATADHIFAHTVLEPERRRLHREGIRRSIKKAVGSMMSDTSYKARLMRNKKEDGTPLISPELNARRATEYYVQQRDNLALRIDAEDVTKELVRQAMKIWNMLVDHADNSKGRNYSFLMQPDGSPPTIETIMKGLQEAKWYSLEKN